MIWNIFNIVTLVDITLRNLHYVIRYNHYKIKSLKLKVVFKYYIKIIKLQLIGNKQKGTHFKESLNLISCSGILYIILKDINECGEPICIAELVWKFSEAHTYDVDIEEPSKPAL